MPLLVPSALALKTAGAGLLLFLMLLAQVAVPIQFSFVVDLALIFVVVGAVWRGGQATQRVESALKAFGDQMIKLEAELRDLRTDGARRNENFAEVRATLETVKQGQAQMGQQMQAVLTTHTHFEGRISKMEAQVQNIGLEVAAFHADLQRLREKAS